MVCKENVKAIRCWIAKKKSVCKSSALIFAGYQELVHCLHQARKFYPYLKTWSHVNFLRLLSLKFNFSLKKYLKSTVNILIGFLCVYEYTLTVQIHKACIYRCSDEVTKSTSK